MHFKLYEKNQTSHVWDDDSIISQKWFYKLNGLIYQYKYYILIYYQIILHTEYYSNFNSKILKIKNIRNIIIINL